MALQRLEHLCLSLEFGEATPDAPAAELTWKLTALQAQAMVAFFESVLDEQILLFRESHPKFFREYEEARTLRYDAAGRGESQSMVSA